MKLDWADRKFRSIADSPCGRWSILVTCVTNGALVRFEGLQEGGCINVPDTCNYLHPSREAAKAAAEAWLDEQDKPEWLTTPDGLAACASWRGWGIVAHRTTSAPTFVSQCVRPSVPGLSNSFWGESLRQVQDLAVAYIRNGD